MLIRVSLLTILFKVHLERKFIIIHTWGSFKISASLWYVVIFIFFTSLTNTYKQGKYKLSQQMKKESRKNKKTSIHGTKLGGVQLVSSATLISFTILTRFSIRSTCGSDNRLVEYHTGLSGTHDLSGCRQNTSLLDFTLSGLHKYICINQRKRDRILKEVKKQFSYHLDKQNSYNLTGHLSGFSSFSSCSKTFFLEPSPSLGCAGGQNRSKTLLVPLAAPGAGGFFFQCFIMCEKDSCV